MSKSWRKEARDKSRKPRYEEEFDLSIIRINSPIEGYLLDSILEDEDLVSEERKLVNIKRNDKNNK